MAEQTELEKLYTEKGEAQTEVEIWSNKLRRLNETILKLRAEPLPELKLEATIDKK